MILPVNGTVTIHLNRNSRPALPPGYTPSPAPAGEDGGTSPAGFPSGTNSPAAERSSVRPPVSFWEGRITHPAHSVVLPATRELIAVWAKSRGLDPKWLDLIGINNVRVAENLAPFLMAAATMIYDDAPDAAAEPS